MKKSSKDQSPVISSDGIERFTGPHGRRYQIWVQRDLFCALVIMRSWSGALSGRGGCKATAFETDFDCERQLRRIRARRYQHGYVPVLRF
jgi:hypothetical protein